MRTNGRGHFLLAVFIWRWADAGAMQHVWTSGPRPDWIATVPPSMDRPPFIPAWARSVLLGDDTCYWWTDTQP